MWNWLSKADNGGRSNKKIKATKKIWCPQESLGGEMGAEQFEWCIIFLKPSSTWTGLNFPKRKEYEQKIYEFVSKS